MNIFPTETLVIEAYTTIGIDGGMTGPIVEDAAVIPALKV